MYWEGETEIKSVLKVPMDFNYWYIALPIISISIFPYKGSTGLPIIQLT